MKRPLYISLACFTALSLACVTGAGAAQKTRDIKKASRETQIKIARSAAPASISKEATVMVFGPDGKLTEAVKGTNGFTCIPDIDGQEKPDPFCGDANATQWVEDLTDGKQSPTNAEPGVAYMMQGGWHWEKDGKITMNRNAPGAKRVAEPPHWMVFWPFKASETMLPTRPTGFGTYIMWDGTPFSHLMIYQSPKALK